MSKRSLFFIFLICAFYSFPKKMGVLSELMKPGMVQVFNDELYVIDGAKILIYSLKNCSLKTKFGKPGEGPGELKVQSDWVNRLTISTDTIYVESIDKIIEFSKNGKVIKERKKPVESAKFVPVGNNFVAKKLKRDLNQKLLFMTIILYNSKMNEIKELYRQKFVQQPAQGGVKIELFSDLLNFQVYDDKIFIEESPKGFFIGVFDKNGKKLYHIEREYKKINVTKTYKDEAIIEAKEDPTVKRRLKQFGSWENLIKAMQFTFPDFMPAIQSIKICNEKIYIRTFKVVNNKEEHIVVDLKGKVLQKLYLPKPPKPGLKARIIGVELYSIANNKLYYLRENEDDEKWELHMEEMI